MQIVTVKDPQADAPLILKHTHRFGHYVAGCEACVVKFPDGPPAERLRAKPGHKYEPKTAENADVVSMPAKIPQAITGDQLMEAIKVLMSGQDQTRKEELIAFAQELKKPDADELAKKAAEKARWAENRVQMVAMIQQAEALKLARQAQCGSYGHKKENGRTAISGQVHNDGLFHALCQRCNKEFDPVRPDSDHMPSGVSVI